MRVLIIDDEPYARMLLKDILEPLQWTVEDVGDCLEGLNILHSQKDCNLAFVDWKTPKMSGVEFVRQVRKNSTFKDLVLVMITGLNEMENVQEALEAGANEYLMKPFTKDMVFDKLRIVGIDIPSQ